MRPTIRTAFRQIQTYKHLIPGLFTYNGFVVISDGLEAKAGTISADYSRFMSWKTIDGNKEASHLISEIETLIRGMLNKETLLDLLSHFIVFEKTRREDLKTGLTFIDTTKKLAAYHQYFQSTKRLTPPFWLLRIKVAEKVVLYATHREAGSHSLWYFTARIH